MKPGPLSVIIAWILLCSLAVGCSRVYHLANTDYQVYQIESSDTFLVVGTEVADMIAPYREELAAEMNEVVGHSVKVLTKAKGESTLGNWVADAVLGFGEEYLKEDLDIAICNTGGLRISSLPNGPITRGMLYELMPFDNYLVLMDLDGSVLKKLFDHMAARDGWPINREVNYVIEDHKASNIMIDGEPLDTAKSYKVLLSDYLAEGGDSCDFLESIPSETLDVYYRDAMIIYAEVMNAKGEELDADIEGRIQKN